MATSNHRYGPTRPERGIAAKCPECGRGHYDSNYERCVECGAHL